MVNKELSAYKHDVNPFLSQNILFRLATGLEGSLFTVYTAGNDPYAKEDADDKDTLNWDYEIPSDGMFYAYCEFPGEDKVSVFFNDDTLRTIKNGRPNIFTLGSFLKGDLITFTTGPEASKGIVKIQVARIESELFDRGYALLTDEILNLTEFSETRITGIITALKDGLLYTSIPNDKNWTASVDGINTTIIRIDGCMTALQLSKGTHNIEFRYHNRNINIGITISLISLAIFAIFFIKPYIKKIK
jgi:uncharacterized membrane protein YfhO